MVRVALILLMLSAPVAQAQETPFGEGLEGFEGFKGFEGLEQDMRRLLEGLIDQMEPGMEALREQLGRFDAYHPPEILPNGDIIIRRKRPLEEDAPMDLPEGGIEL